MTDWFLRGSPKSADEWCFETVPTKEIRIYPSYQEYFERLAELLKLAKRGDKVLMVGWAFTLGESLQGTSSLFELLKVASINGTSVRILATDNNLDAKGYNDNVNQIKAVPSKVDALLDSQLPPGSTHHQKAVYMRIGGIDHLFVGGMDIAAGRVNQWYDVQAEVIGRGASLGARSLEERWESVKPPGRGAGVLARTPTKSEKNESFSVQFVRTYPPTQKTTRRYAIDGDYTYYQLIFQAIERAQKTIYIEDQFFFATPAPSELKVANPKDRKRSDLPSTPKPLGDLLLDAAKRGVRIVIIAAAKDSVNQYCNACRDKIMKVLARSKRISLLEPSPTALFVHSKVWIFDDELVVVGSGNFWSPSFFSTLGASESELAVAFVGNDGGNFGYPRTSAGRAIRLRLWERIRQSFDPSERIRRVDSFTFEQELEDLLSPLVDKNHHSESRVIPLRPVS